MPDCVEDGQSVDILAEIFETVHVQSASIARLEVPPLLAAEMPKTRSVALYAVLDGQLLVEMGGVVTHVRQGDVFCFPKGDAHVLGTEGAGSPQAGSGFEVSPGRLTDAPREGVASVLRGLCVFAEPEKNPLLCVLPHLIHVTSSQWLAVSWLKSTIDLLAREAENHKPGSSSVINRLVELLLVQLVRAYVATTQSASQGWLRALSDAQIGGALGIIHERPATMFTVASLAQAVGMSRSAFASQFTRLVGEPPLHYVARWRMLKAAQLLKENRLTLAEVAAAVGYESEAAFSKAFKRWSGQAPGCYRRERRATFNSERAQAMAG